MFEITKDTLFENIDFDLFSYDNFGTIEFNINDFEIKIDYIIKYYTDNEIGNLNTDIGCILDGVELLFKGKESLETQLEEEIYKLYHISKY